jgi:Na+-transporting methylmalonyl-CoA/oxaloacetate decarboxylase gamma subunit
MTAGGTTRPEASQGGAGYPAPPPPPAPYPPFGPHAQGPRRGRGVLAGIGIVLAIALAAAALVVSLISARHDQASPPPAAPPASSQPASTADADKALCVAIAPLIKESNTESKAYTSTGDAGTPGRDAATPGFVDQTADWVKRAQPVLDQYATPPRYLTRSLQRYIDDMHMFAGSVRPGPGTSADKAAWEDGLVALGGPYEVCGDAGVPLW